MEIIATFQGLDLVVMGDQVITLNTGGRHTPIMQYRINQIARQLDLPLEIVIRGGEWLVRTPTRAYRFVDGMELQLGPGRDWYESKKLSQVRWYRIYGKRSRWALPPLPHLWLAS